MWPSTTLVVPRPGVGLIITEGTYIDELSAGNKKDVPRFYGDSIPGWARVVDAVHRHGGAIFPQLWHVGPYRVQGSEPHSHAPVLSPSGIMYDGRSCGEPMSTVAIDRVVASFARAAKLAFELNFDGVELHGAHGYILDSFLWRGTNHPTDSYGETPHGRARLTAEVVNAIRGEVGSSFPIALRFSQWKVHSYDARIADDPLELEALLIPLVEAGVTLFHASTRRFWELAFETSNLGLAGWVRKITGTTTMTVGSVGLAGAFTPGTDASQVSVAGLEPLHARFDAGEFDLVAVGRALLHDHQWVSKIRDGRIDELHPFERQSTQVLY